MSKRTGFTLLELVVAMAVFSILLVLTLNVLSHAGSLSSSGMSKMEASRVARECLDLISRDLGSAALPYNRAATNSLQLIANPSDLPTNYANPNSLFWQAPLSRSLTNGNLALVGYFAHRAAGATPEENRFQLRRLYVEPSNTNDYSELNTNTNWYGQLVPKFASASNALEDSQGYKGWVADGVLGLWVRCLNSKGEPIKLNAAGSSTGMAFDSRKAFQDSRYRFPAIGFSALPPYIEIGLVTCSPSDVRRIKVLPASAPGGNPDTFHQDINAFVEGVRTQNPGVKTVAAYTRIVPILTADP